MLSDKSFHAVTSMFHRVSGIRLSPAKQALVAGRLQRLAQDRGMTDLDAYVKLLIEQDDPDELVKVVDKLTTNETYFFREPDHFKHLAQTVLAWAADNARGNGLFRVWSAASSSGEEAYSIAMVLADKLGPQGWEVLGTDLSTAMVDSARRALYPLERARDTPMSYLKRYCRKGEGQHEGQMLISRELRNNVHFGPANLMEELPDIGQFQIIFLRNVLIYFDPPAKEQIVRRVMTKLAPGGLLYTGHAESLNGLDTGARSLQPAIYAPA